MLLQLQGQPFHLNLIQVYAPTADKNDTEIENFYADISTALNNVKKHEINITMGDFNAKVGHGKVEGIIGDFGLGSRNERGDRLVQFCQEEDLVVTNTFYKLPPRRLYTLHVKLKKIHRPKVSSRIDVTQLKDLDTHRKVHLAANDEIVRLKTTDSVMVDVDKTWSDLKSAFTHIGKNNLKPPPYRMNKLRTTTTEILDLIQERRKVKGKDTEQYKKTSKNYKEENDRG